MAVEEANADLEKTVATRTVELTAAVHELEAFAYSVSHDLRAPLRAMNGFSKKLSERVSVEDPELGRYADRIAANAERMGRLIDELLALSRMSLQPMLRQRFRPGEIVQRALEDLADVISATDAQNPIRDWNKIPNPTSISGNIK